MKHMLIVNCLLIAFFIYADDQAYYKQFVIVITSRNNKDWYQKNLDSALNQNYPRDKFKIIYIDDASTDNTAQLVEQYIQQRQQTNLVTLIKNTTWQSQMANHYRAVYLCNDTDIVVHLDGDDWFAHNDVLKFLNKIYSTTDTWITYGQCRLWPGNVHGPCAPIPQNAIKNNSFRQQTWMYGHLRSFYAGLFKQIKLQDLMHASSFSPMSPSPDIAFMIPMLEMAGNHVRFISQILYIWNRANPLSQANLRPNCCLEVLNLIRQWPRYEPLSSSIIRRHKAYEQHSAHVIIFSANGLQASKQAIISAQQNIKNSSSLFLVCQTNNFAEKEQYKKLARSINNLSVITYNPAVDGTVAHKLKTMLASSSHVVFLTDNDVISSSYDAQACIRALEQTFALGFYLDIKPTDLPTYAVVTQEIGAWQFASSRRRTNITAYTTHKALYRTRDVLNLTSTFSAKSITGFIAQWHQLNSSHALDRTVGLFALK